MNPMIIAELCGLIPVTIAVLALITYACRYGGDKQRLNAEQLEVFQKSHEHAAVILSAWGFLAFVVWALAIVAIALS